MRCYDSFNARARPFRALLMMDRRQRSEDLRMRYIASFAQKRVALAAAWYSFLVDPRVEAHRRSLHAQVHRLAGSAVAYGFGRLGELARLADRLLRAAEDTPTDTRAIMDLLADDLREPIGGLLSALERGGAPSRPALPTAGPLFSVLLVEEDLAQAELLAAQLGERGCAVHVADSAALGQHLVDWPCDALVMDFWLRGETATEIAATLRRDSRFAAIALVCYSAESEPELLRRALDAGCDAALAKSGGVDRLLDVLFDCIAQKQRAHVHPDA